MSRPIEVQLYSISITPDISVFWHLFLGVRNPATVWTHNLGLEPICQYYKVYLLQLKLFQIDFALKTIKWSNAVKWCCIIERLFWILRQWIRWHLDFICMFWALLCQNGFVGKKETWCCLVVFLEIFEAGGHAVVSYWIACFLLTTRHQKIFVPPDVWCQCLPRQCSRACSLVYFPLHALCHRHLATCFIILVTWSVTFSCRKWNCLYWQSGQRGVSCKEVKGSGETLHSENVTGRGTWDRGLLKVAQSYVLLFS